MLGLQDSNTNLQLAYCMVGHSPNPRSRQVTANGGDSIYSVVTRWHSTHCCLDHLRGSVVIEHKLRR